MQNTIEVLTKLSLKHPYDQKWNSQLDNTQACIIKKVEADIPENLVNFARKCAIDHQLHNCEILKTASGIKGDGYMGVVTFLKVTGLDKNNQKTTMDIVVKCAHTDEQLRNKLPINNIFKREIDMYTKVFPELQTFQKEYKLTAPFAAFTECLHHSIEDKHEAILLQNIKTLGYGLWDRQKPMNKEHLEIVLKEYAKLHAVGFAMKQDRADLWKWLTKDLGNIWDDQMYDFIPMYVNMIDGLQVLFDKNVDTAEYNVLLKIKENLKDILDRCHNETNEYSVLLHGDCWCNNMMFKYNNAKSPNTPTNVCFIDFQLSRVGSLVLDLSYFFFACSSNEAVDNFHYYIEQVYYKALENQLKEFGINVTTVYPLKKLWQEWKRYGIYGFLFAAMVCKLAMSDVDEVPDIADMVEDMHVMEKMTFKCQGVYDEKMKCLVKLLAKNNLF